MILGRQLRTTRTCPTSSPCYWQRSWISEILAGRRWKASIARAKGTGRKWSLWSMTRKDGHLSPLRSHFLSAIDSARPYLAATSGAHFEDAGRWYSGGEMLTHPAWVFKNPDVLDLVRGEISFDDLFDWECTVTKRPATSRKNGAHSNARFASAITCSFGIKPRSSSRLACWRDSPDPSHWDFSSLSVPPALTAPHGVQISHPCSKASWWRTCNDTRKFLVCTGCLIL